jgi:hypothetical protein
LEISHTINQLIAGRCLIPNVPYTDTPSRPSIFSSSQVLSSLWPRQIIPIFNSNLFLAQWGVQAESRWTISVQSRSGTLLCVESDRFPSPLLQPNANTLRQSLNDFKSTSCFAPLAYGYLWISLIISIAVYGVDTFTAVNLLAFNKWSGEIEPIIPLKVSRWIFSICIILSWVNLGYEHLRAMRVIKRGAVAESYLDSLAVRLQSIRLGKGRGWRRFLVFAELTKSKKGTEYVALFTYFAFQCKNLPSTCHRCLLIYSQRGFASSSAKVLDRLSML